MAEFAQEYGRRLKRLDAGALKTLQRYPWPGNVRELRNVIERLMIMVPGESISAADLAFLAQRGGASPEPIVPVQSHMTLHEPPDRFDPNLILRPPPPHQANLSPPPPA